MRALFLEPFDTGSHAAFGRALTGAEDCEWIRWTLPGRHWKWRMRGAGLWFASQAAARELRGLDVLLASSFTPLADVVALCPALAGVPRVLYFHEDQWSYPDRPAQDGGPGHRPERDHHFGVTQLVSAAAADRIWFNSRHCRQAFLRGCRDFLARMPDARPPGLVDTLEERSEVVGFPVDFGAALPGVAGEEPPGPARASGPILLWPHRWEHDKAPEDFFAACDALAARGVPFRLAVCGERYRQTPPVFEAARRRHAERIEHWGHLPSRQDFLALLGRSHVAVSTARHEFFGVAMLEAAHGGARPLVPDALAYPEQFPADYRYRGPDELVATLEQLCRRWTHGELELRADRRAALTADHDARVVVPRLVAGLRQLVPAGRPSSRSISRGDG